jgi:hypothetical protein
LLVEVNPVILHVDNETMVMPVLQHAELVFFSVSIYAFNETKVCRFFLQVSRKILQTMLLI